MGAYGGIPETAELEVAAARQPQRIQRVLVALCMGLFASGLIGLVVIQSDDGNRGPATPDQELARAQAFVRRARTAHFTGTSESEMKNGKDGLGSTYTDRSRVTGVIEVPFKSRTIDESGDFVIETIVVEHGSYFREADDRAALGREQWTYEPRVMPTDPDVIEDLDQFSTAPFVASAFDSPDLVALLRAAQTPTPVRSGVVRADIDVRKLDGLEQFYNELDVPLPKIDIEVHSGPDGRLTRLVLNEVSKVPAFDEEDEPNGETEQVMKADLQFSRWGEPVDIAAPPRAEIDPTPGVEEDDISGFTAMPLLAPAPQALPAGFELLGASVFTEENDEEFGECAEVDLEYGDGTEMDAFMADPDEDAEYPLTLDLILTPASCDYYGALGDDGSAIRLGRRTGRIVRGDVDDDEYGTTIEVVIGATRVTIESDLPEKTVVVAASSLVPLDLAAQPVHRVEPPH